jgi:hypothetical protein
MTDQMSNETSSTRLAKVTAHQAMEDCLAQRQNCRLLSFTPFCFSPNFFAPSKASSALQWSLHFLKQLQSNQRSRSRPCHQSIDEASSCNAPFATSVGQCDIDLGHDGSEVGDCGLAAAKVVIVDE